MLGTPPLDAEARCSMVLDAPAGNRIQALDVERPKPRSGCPRHSSYRCSPPRTNICSHQCQKRNCCRCAEHPPESGLERIASMSCWLQLRFSSSPPSSYWCLAYFQGALMVPVSGWLKGKPKRTPKWKPKRKQQKQTKQFLKSPIGLTRL